MLRYHHHLLWVLQLCLACLLLSPAAFGQDLTYDNIDRATVRVLAMGSVDLESVEHDNQTYQVAIPIAGHGSGVVLSEDGLILTAAHVVEDARAIAVMVPGTLGPLPALVVHRDSTRDFALLRVLGRYSNIAKLADANQSLAVRQSVFAIGYPLDATRVDPQSTPGIISGVLPDGQLQLGMSVNPGNSGGPVVDSDGLVRAIVVARGRLEEGVVGMAFAVPVKAFHARVSAELSASLSAEQSAYLQADTSKRLADLTALMSLYGLDVLTNSFATSELEVDPRVKGALDDASTGSHASADGRLLSAVFFWNQSLVLHSRGDARWRELQRRALGLVQTAVRAEPALATQSPFAKLLLSLEPSILAPEVAPPPPPQTAWPLLVPVSRRTPGPSFKFPKLRGYFGAEVGTGNASLEIYTTELSGWGLGWGVNGGLRFGPDELAFDVGLIYRSMSTVLVCDACREGSKTEWQHSAVGLSAAFHIGFFYAAVTAQDVQGELKSEDRDTGISATLPFQTLGFGLDVGALYRIKFLELGAMLSLLKAHDRDALIDNQTITLSGVAQCSF